MVFTNNLLEIPPGVFQGLHGKPGVGVGAHIEGLDLLVQCGQGFEVSLGGGQGGLELGVRLPQCTNLLDGVAADGIREVFLGVLKPAVEGRRLLGEGQVEVFDLPELLLKLQQALLAFIRVSQQLLPSI